MPNTGQFYLLKVTGETKADGTLAWVDRVESTCCSCMRTFAATEGKELIELARGAVVACPACGNHQTISLAYFDDFITRQGQSARAPSTKGP